tara:strand:+ start:4077 stop:4898 length:822 start_codon:yes stop_codon:yes gene_type:complete
MSSIFPRIDDYDEDKDLIRHTMLNIIRKYNVDYRDKYGETIVCFDAGNSWRRQKFAPYKANRRKNRDNSIHDWNGIFNMVNQVREDIIELSPYRCIFVDGCEADDAIGWIVHNQHDTDEHILIVSPDNDFKQLQCYENVVQYSNIQKKWIKCKDAEEELWMKIVKGDTGDGVPNILSDDEVLITEGARQTPVTQKQLKMLQEDPNTWPTRIQKNWLRNKDLIDLQMTPPEYTSQIQQQFNEEPKGNIQLWMNYLMKHKMKLLLESLDDFEIRY